VCACGDVGGALGIHMHVVRVQSEGQGGSYGRFGRRAVVGWCVGFVGERTGSSFPSTPQPSGRALAVSVREKEGKVR
jgi:hypothetical protein